MSIGSKLPLVYLDRVYHVGTLNSAHKGRSHTQSLEGNCLSVSLCPAAWRAIAKLGGYPLYELSGSGGRFLDVYAALGDEALRREALNWARSQGLVEERQMWRSWRFDDEVGDWSALLSATQDEALFEALNWAPSDNPDDLDAPAGHEAVEPALVIVGAAQMSARIGWTHSDDRDMSDMAVMLWAQEALPMRHGVALDGVWWRERYDPSCLSAPRGGIFPARISNWRRSRVDWSAAPADDVREPRVTWVAGDVVPAQKDGTVIIDGVRWIKPTPEWVARHGGAAYCVCCRAEGKKKVSAYVPTDRKSVTHRRAFAACETHLPQMAEKLLRLIEMERREAKYETEAEHQLFWR